MENNVFEVLNKINVNDKVEKKNGLSYLSWAYAWGEVKKVFPTATYTVYENKDGWNYFTDGRTGWVKTGVTINEIEYIEYLPVMDYKNQSIPADKITSFDVNKAIQRSLTKAIARHGLGLYIYAGEDLPAEELKVEQPKVVQEGFVRYTVQQMQEYLKYGYTTDQLVKKLNKPTNDISFDEMEKLLNAIRKTKGVTNA